MKQEQYMPLRCGAARRCVTPALGLNIPQCMTPNYAVGVKDDLYTHALAVEGEGGTAILISIDTSGLGTNFTRRVRAALNEALGIPSECVMVSAIHIHTGGPQLLDVFWGQGRDRAVEDFYLRETVAAAVEAYETRVPVTARYFEGREDRISFCRNYRMRDGSILMNPGKRRAAEIVGPVSEIDHTLSSLRFDDLSGTPVAEIVNFACHPDTVGGQEYCADYPGALRRNLRRVYGEGYTVLFFNGCSGNVNHIDAPKRRDPDFRYPKDHYETMGRILADDLLALHRDGGRSVTVPRVDAALKRFRAPRRQPTETDLTWAEEKLASESASKVDKRLAAEVRRLEKHPKRFENVEMQAIRIGDVAFVGFPGEPFADIGLRLRARSPFGSLMISELANNELGYFATEPAYSGRVYEAILPSACFELPVLDRMIDTAVELLEGMGD